MYDTGEYSINDLAELFGVAKPTVYRTLKRELGEGRKPAGEAAHG